MRAVTLTCVALIASACRPVFDDDTPSWITTDRLLAVIAEPAEARPGESFTLRAIVAGVDGTVAAPDVTFALCSSPKPLGENGVVNPACLGALPPLAPPSATITMPMPGDACRLFGPDVPPTPAGEIPARPRDADATGGYYQPLRADLETSDNIALVRLRCNLAGASFGVAQDFASRYTTNRNPQLISLSFTEADRVLDPMALPAGATITVAATYTEDSVETFPVFDLASGALRDQQESLHLSWYTTRGVFAATRTGRAPDDRATSASSDNTWIAPHEAGVVHLWVVLRDSRGGMAVLAQSVYVSP